MGRRASLVAVAFLLFAVPAVAPTSGYFSGSHGPGVTHRSCCSSAAGGSGYSGNVQAPGSILDKTRIYAYSTVNGKIYRDSGNVTGPVSENLSGTYLVAFRYCRNWGSTSYTDLCYVSF